MKFVASINKILGKQVKITQITSFPNNKINMMNFCFFKEENTLLGTKSDNFTVYDYFKFQRLKLFIV